MRPVLQGEIEEIKKNLERFPDLEESLGKKWITSHLTIEERPKKHPIFRRILNINVCQKITNNLQILKGKNQGIFKIFINKLKKEKNEDNFCSLLSEIEVISYYLRKLSSDYKIEYAPKLKEINKKTDVRITKDKKVYNLEICTLLEDGYDRDFDKMNLRVAQIINSMKDNPHYIIVAYRRFLTEEEIVLFKEFIEKKIKNKNRFYGKKTFNFSLNGGIVAQVTFFNFNIHENAPGGFGGCLSPARGVNESGRIKKKILNKIEQLPENSLNIIVVDISDSGAEFRDAINAFFGEAYYKIILPQNNIIPKRKWYCPARKG